ncbi:MAG: hypothetical protein ABFD18_09130 [Syntrophomonas sp.]
MPRINRIRIVNFSYNNDSRHIVDEWFNFHGGENALLSLSNGGGKSVLVQLFLQAVVPGARIQGRNIAGFFRKNKQPSYIMIEWKLDGSGGYLLTGIGITRVEAAESDASKPRIRYFTFTSKYNGASPFDIAHIPLMERDGKVLELKSFREARKILADKERKDPYLVGYFPEDEGDTYARRLAEFGISQDEWRNVLVRINEGENGLEDLFKKYKSSSQLLDDWIIKTVEKVMFKGRSEHKQLEEMLYSLVQEVVENERFLLERQLFTGFLENFQEMLVNLGILLKDLEEEKLLGSNLAALYAYLGQEIESHREKQQLNQQAIEEARDEELRVDLEERSHEYQIRAGRHQAAEERLKAAEESSGEIENRLAQAKSQEKILLAARLAEDMRHILSELSGIEEKLDMAREGYNRDERARSLEFTLKIKYEELAAAMAAELARLRAEQSDRQERLTRDKGERASLEKEKSRLDSEQGSLAELVKVFNGQEKRVQKRLGRQWVRNLLGELDELEMNQIQNSLFESKNRLLSDQQNIAEEKASLAGQLQDLDGEWKDANASLVENNRNLKDLERDLAQYLQRESQIKEILEHYGFEPSLVFDRDGLSSLFSRHIRNLEHKGEAASRTRNEAAEALLSIRDGYLHTSQDLAAALAELDIAYDTGESYLRNQSPDIRQAMLHANPILPYALIMSKPDMASIAGAGLNVISHRIIPLLAYEDLNMLVDNQGGIARPREEIALACLYEGRVFDHEGLNQLILEMEDIKKEAAESYEHFSGACRSAWLDREACQRFGYAQNYRYDLEKNIAAARQLLLELDNSLTNIDEARKQVAVRQEHLEQEGRILAGQLPRVEEDLNAFREFTENEPEYQRCRTGLVRITHEIANLERKKALLEQSLEKLQADISLGNNQITTQERLEQEAAQKYLLYRNAAPADRVDGGIEELEQRLTVIKDEYGQEIGQLEKRRQELNTQNGKTQKQLDKLGLAEEDYSSVRFDEALADSIHEEITRLEAEWKIRQQKEKKASRDEAAAANALANALDEVKKLGAEEPLPPQEIKGDFAGRRDSLRRHIQELIRLNKSLEERLSLYERARASIEQAVNLTAFDPEKLFTPEADVIAQAARWEKNFRNFEHENRKNADKLRNLYAECKSGFREKNPNLDNIFKGLDPLWEQAQNEFDDFFYLFERMSQHSEKLTELLAIYETQLANLERNKKDMVQQSFLQGRRIYEEIDLISENSKVRLPGRSRPVHMLKIELQYDNQDSAWQRVNDYIEDCIAQVREKTRQEHRDDDLRKTVARLMSSRELLNVYLGNAHIPVQVFKIDMNMHNSRLKVWEDAVRENSGAEKFVVFFSLLSALMTYTRARSMEALGADPQTDTRVIIMDNPFGPISSEHLLQPMFEIAKRHHTQLICLSDLKQNSIMNCFNLIYMLKVRTAAVGGNEYLKFEEYVRDENALSYDEMLEKAIYRASEFKQMPLFSDDE